jgi:hypothetical protein
MPELPEIKRYAYMINKRCKGLSFNSVSSSWVKHAAIAVPWGYVTLPFNMPLFDFGGRKCPFDLACIHSNRPEISGVILNIIFDNKNINIKL